MTDFSLQTLLVFAIVAAAALYVGRRVWRTVAAARRSKADGCGTGCGCGDVPAKRDPFGL